MRRRVAFPILLALTLSGCSATNQIDQQCEVAADRLTGDLSYKEHEGAATEELAVSRLAVLKKLQDDVNAIEPSGSEADRAAVKAWTNALDGYVGDTEEIVGYFREEDMALDVVIAMSLGSLSDSAATAGRRAAEANLTVCAESATWETWE